MVWTVTHEEHDFVMPEDCQSFAEFQDLDPEIREALVLYLVGGDMTQAVASLVPSESDVMPVDALTRAKQHLVRSLLFYGENALSMARCWAECDRDMILAKLTWSPGY